MSGQVAEPQSIATSLGDVVDSAVDAVRQAAPSAAAA